MDEETFAVLNAKIKKMNGTDQEAIGEAVDSYFERNKIVSADKISIKATSSGSNITLDDASDLPLSGLKIYGRSTQFTTTGAQLINAEELVRGGLEEVTGNEFTSAKRIRTGFVRVEAGGIYSLSGYAPYVIANSHIFGEDKTTRINSFTSGVQIPENGCWIRNSFKREDDGEITEHELTQLRKKIMLNEGSTALPWERYTGGQPLPNPDYPQEIVSVVETKIYGKNLFDAEKYVEIAKKTEPGTEVVTFDGRRCLHIPIKLHNLKDYIFAGFKANKKYKFEFEGYSATTCINGNGNGFYFVTEDIGKVYVLIPKNAGINKWVKIKKTVECKKIIGLGATFGTMHECYIDLDSIKLVEGDDMECEPCAVQTLTMQTPNGLCGIPVASGGNYTDADGQQWICDEVDFERGVYVQRVGKIALTGAENIQKRVPSGPWMFYLTENTGISNQMLNTEIMCTHFRKGMRGWTEKTSGEIMNNTGSIIFTWDSSKSVADFKAMLEEQYESGKPVTAQFILGNPVETPIPPEELAAYRALHTNNPITYIINEEGAHMDVGYTADTERYINKNYVAKKAYDALEQRVAALEANAIS